MTMLITNETTATRFPRRNHGNRGMDHAPPALRTGSALSTLKDRLLDETLQEVSHPQVRAWLRLAAGEAEALAWLTPFPLLLFPVLYAEKTEAIRRYVARQARLKPLAAAESS